MDSATQQPVIEEESKTMEAAAPVEVPKKQVKPRKPRNSVNSQPKYASILSTNLRGEKLIAHAAYKRFGERCVSTSEGIAMNALAGNLQSMMIEGEIIVTENKTGGINVAFNGFKTNYSKIPDSAFLCIRDAIGEYMSGSSFQVAVPVSVPEEPIVASPSVTPVQKKKRTRLEMPTAPSKRRFSGKGEAIAFRMAAEQAASLENKEDDDEDSVKLPGDSDSDSDESLDSEPSEEA